MLPPPLVLAFCFAGACLAQTSFQPSGAPFRAPVSVAPGFSASVLFSNLTAPRGIALDALQNVLVVERGFGITAFSPVSGGNERTVVLRNANFTQGIQVDGEKLYVSTAGEALQLNYDAARKRVVGLQRIIVDGIPPDGDLTTHTLQLDGRGNILVAVGPKTNIDPTARDPSSGRSQIRSFSLAKAATETLSFFSGTLVAYGIRNPAGFAFSPLAPSTTLFAVENGASIDNVTGLTAAFVNDNPADELERIRLDGNGARFFGFPDCTTMWNPRADPVGDPQYVDFTRGEQFSLKLEAERDDKWCQKEENNEPPILSFQAHSVPLDIKFFTSPNKSSSTGFPSTFKNDAFVSFHGSFDRTPPTGYGVVHVPFSGNAPTSQNYTFVIQAADLSSCPGSCIRPVGLVFGNDGVLYVSSDSSGELFVLRRTAAV